MPIRAAAKRNQVEIDQLHFLIESVITAVITCANLNGKTLMEIQKIILNTTVLTGKRRENIAFYKQIQINVMIQVRQVPFSAPVSFKISMQNAPFVLI